MCAKNVLICDDNIDITDMLEMVLVDTGAKLHVVNDSLLAVEKIKGIRPEVLIVDLWMPAMTGDEIIRTIRSTPEISGTYIICISASFDGKSCALNAGADQFIAKPFDLYDLMTAVSSRCSTLSA